MSQRILRGLLAAGMVGLGVPALLTAQHQRTVATVDSLRVIQTMEPRSGPIGTRVNIYTENLPPQARVHIGVGKMGLGWEALAEAFQGRWGEVSATLAVPEFGAWDEPMMFIVFNGIFAPIGISEPFHVTNQDGLVLRAGSVQDGSGTCPTMLSEDGFVYALLGDIEELEAGDRIRVEARFEEISHCTEGDALRVMRVLPADESTDEAEERP